MITIKKFKSVKWFDKKTGSITYGVDMVTIDRTSYHCLRQRGKPLIFTSKNEAVREVKKLNQELKIAIEKKQ